MTAAVEGGEWSAARFGRFTPEKDPVPIVQDRGGTVVKMLCYKSEGPWFDPTWCH